MEEVLVLHKQSFWDLAIQKYGTIEAVVQLAFANDMSITDELNGGMVLKVPTYDEPEQNVVNFYEAYQVRPATSLTDEVFDIIDNIDPCNYCKCFT